MHQVFKFEVEGSRNFYGPFAYMETVPFIIENEREASLALAYAVWGTEGVGIEVEPEVTNALPRVFTFATPQGRKNMSLVAVFEVTSGTQERDLTW